MSSDCLSVRKSEKLIKACSYESTEKCFGKFTLGSDIVIRGCADEDDPDYQECLTKSPAYCSICVGNLCNHWEAFQDSELMCSFCTSQVACSSKDTLSRKCPVVASPESNVFCYTSFDRATGIIEERGCSESKALSDYSKYLILPCLEDNCNTLQDMEEFTCTLFSGFVSRFNYQKQTVQCNRHRLTEVPGCYTIFNGKTAEMGCNSQLPFKEFKALMKFNSSAQFCYEPNCNGLEVNLCVSMNLKDSLIRMEICLDTKTRCYLKPGK